jgi:hypothetical protein
MIAEHPPGSLSVAIMKLMPPARAVENHSPVSPPLAKQVKPRFLISPDYQEDSANLGAG